MKSARLPDLITATERGATTRSGYPMNSYMDVHTSKW